MIDSAGAIAACIAGGVPRLGLPVPDEARARHVIGLGLADSLAHAVPGLAPSEYPRVAERYRKHFLAREDADLPLFPGTREMLKSFARTGTSLRSRPARAARASTARSTHTGLRRCLRRDPVRRRERTQAAPAMLLELLGMFAVEPATRMMVGDTSHDLRMAAHAGVDAVGVTTVRTTQRRSRRFGPLELVHSTDELARWLAANA